VDLLGAASPGYPAARADVALLHFGGPAGRVWTAPELASIDRGRWEIEQESAMVAAGYDLVRLATLGLAKRATVRGGR